MAITYRTALGPLVLIEHVCWHCKALTRPKGDHIVKAILITVKKPRETNCGGTRRSDQLGSLQRTSGDQHKRRDGASMMNGRFWEV